MCRADFRGEDLAATGRVGKYEKETGGRPIPGALLTRGRLTEAAAGAEGPEAYGGNSHAFPHEGRLRREGLPMWEGSSCDGGWGLTPVCSQPSLRARRGVLGCRKREGGGHRFGRAGGPLLRGRLFKSV